MLFRFPDCQPINSKFLLGKLRNVLEELQHSLYRMELEPSTDQVRHLALEMETNFADKAMLLLKAVREMDKEVKKQLHRVTLKTQADLVSLVKECYGIAVDLLHIAMQWRVEEESEVEDEAPLSSVNLDECERFAANALCTLSQESFV